MKNKWYEQKPCVIIDGEYVLVDNVEFINIEEDISGQDLMTFIYQDQKRKSYIVLH
jgi:predicted thioredoxin/glutaredoxin